MAQVVREIEMIRDEAARDGVIEQIKAVAARKRFSADWTTAKYLARGEMIVGIYGGFANSVIYTPAYARSDVSYDRVMFYGPTGVLVHEEPARGSIAAYIEG